jgi:ferredoxin-NADP reductase
MAGLAWEVATVAALRDETPHVRTIALDVPGLADYKPGQHVDIRLTAADGYQAQRSYSIASAPGDGAKLELTIERVEGGEVSPFLHDEVIVGDRFEVRGPIGGYFVWDGSMAGPLLLVAGGSGIVPLMSIIRHRARIGSSDACTLLYSSKTKADIIYAAELETLAAQNDGLRIIHTLTREQPTGWTGYGRRIDQAMLGEVLASAGANPSVFACGPTPLVEVAATSLVTLGLAPSQVRTERFGPSGA